MAQIEQLLRKLDDAETLNAELLAALKRLEAAAYNLHEKAEWEAARDEAYAVIAKARGA